MLLSLVASKIKSNMITKNMLGESNLESIDRTVPREAPENAMLDKVDLKMVEIITLSLTYLLYL